MSAAVQAAAAEAVLMQSQSCDAPVVKGYEWRGGPDVNYDELLRSYATSGFQAGHFGEAIEMVNEALKWSLGDVPVPSDEDEELKSDEARAGLKAKIFLGFTSNLISSGLRETFNYLCRERMVQVLVSTAGGVEEDFIKCLAPTHTGAFAMDGLALRRKGHNRIGNLIAPNANYCKFEDWFVPIINAMHDEQERDGIVWTPSKMIARLGKEINDETSVYYQCYKHNIPVFSPALTDGSIGDMIYFHSFKREGFVLDIAGDVRLINDEAAKARKTACIILGGGVVKHHILNANLMRNGTDWAVFVNTAQEFDGCDSGAQPDEAVSWGKIRVDGKKTKVCADATLVFPLLVAQTFARSEGRVTAETKFNKNHTTSENEEERKKLFAGTDGAALTQ